MHHQIVSFSLSLGCRIVMYLVCEEGYHHVQKPPSQHYFTCTHLDTRMKIINPLSPKSDQHQISPCNINAW